MLTHAVEDDLDLDRDPWEMANLYPRDTGLRHTVWVSPRGRARHDARVKVCMAPGDRMDPDNLAVMSIRPTPRLLHGELPSRDEAAVRAWIELNAPLLLGYWEGTVSTVELAKGLQTVSPE